MNRGHIFLIGYMASGKTTFGRALAQATGRRFVDLDEYIEHQQGRTISEIFRNSGEEYFRHCETAALGQLAADSNLIVACGGGTACRDENMRLINDCGLSVWLDAPVDVLLRRLRLARSARPLVASLDEGDELEKYVATNLEKRVAAYSRAQMRIDSSRLETEQEISQTVEHFLTISKP